ncbi:MAG: hypothetical protein HYT43_00295 [Candidatus Taylorbacteria bacterium]|nr:hypothetical protein [Candidatus Taylorbacteria bacterium]
MRDEDVVKDKDMWMNRAADGTILFGVRGADSHIHETGFGTGEIKVQSTGEHIPFNNFVREVDELLPPEWRLK